MRKFAKIMAVLLALGFAASCSAEKKAVTKWSGTLVATVYFTFYNDGTAEMTNSENDDVTHYTYTGDTRKNGSITMDDGVEKMSGVISGDELVIGGILTFTKMK